MLSFPDHFLLNSSKFIQGTTSLSEGSEIRINAAGRLECPRCNIKTYARPSLFGYHLKYECGLDRISLHRVQKKKKIFTRKGHLQTHIRHVHHNERRFPCNVCTKIFKRKRIFKFILEMCIINIKAIN